MRMHQDRSRIARFLLLPIVSGGGALLLPAHADGQLPTKTERFNTDPGWDGRNNRSITAPPVSVTQNFGFTASAHAGGPSGEVGGFITPTGEPAYYAKVLSNLTFNDAFSVTGKLNVEGGGHTLLGFFNSSTVNEWRTANSAVIRLYGRGDYFYAYPEFGTGKWRASAASFPGSGDDFHFASGNAVHTFSLQYNPAGNGGNGMMTAMIDSQTTTVGLPPGYKADGAVFNRFGMLNVVKSYDGPGRFWIDNVSINGGATETFNSNPNWEGLRNNMTYGTQNVRFRFNFGYSPTRNANGAANGEMGGELFRGDSRDSSKMAYYGDRLQDTLDFTRPLHAEGKVSFHRGVSDSTTHIGFFHSTDSVRVSSAQASGVPENFIGATIEGPSAEGFFFYPTYNTDIENQGSGGNRGSGNLYIYPNGASHNWSFDYNPDGAGGLGQIIVTLDGQQAIMNLASGDKNLGAHFNRFGIVTTQIDGNGQTVYFDDLTYSFAVPEPSTAGAAIVVTGVLALRRKRERQA